MRTRLNSILSVSVVSHWDICRWGIEFDLFMYLLLMQFPRRLDVEAQAEAVGKQLGSAEEGQ